MYIINDISGGSRGGRMLTARWSQTGWSDLDVDLEVDFLAGHSCEPSEIAHVFLCYARE